METKAVSFHGNLQRLTKRKVNTQPLKYHIPKNYYMDTEKPKVTIFINKCINYIKSIPGKIAKAINE